MTSKGGNPPMNASNPDPLEELLAEAGLAAFPPEVQREVEDILAAGQSLEPAARVRFIEAAKRGTREWDLRSHAPLETLLFEERRRRGIDAERLSAALGIETGSLRAIESGDSTIRGEAASVIASWAMELVIARELLEVALRRSLGSRGNTPAYAGEHRLLLEPEEDRFIDDVLRLYDDRSSTRD